MQPLRRLASLALALSIPAVVRPARAEEPPKCEPRAECAKQPARPWLSLRPYWAHSFVADEVSHDELGASLDVYASRRFALGGDFAVDAPFNPDGDARAQKARLLSETQWFGAVHVSYVLLPGRLRTWEPDVYLVGGVGAIATRPLSVVDPAIRTYGFKPKAALVAGLGVRFHVAPGVLAGVEARDTLYHELLENRVVQPAEPLRKDPDTWFGATELVNRVEIQLGVTFLFPPL